jgi:hypothetical protein
MSLFQSSSRQAGKPHLHVDNEVCPWCEQPISHDKFEDIKRRMSAEHDARMAAMREEFARDKASTEAKARAAVEQARAEAAEAAAQRVKQAQLEAKAAAEAAMLQRFDELQARLVEAEQARTAAHQQMAALKEAQEEALNLRFQEARDALQREKDAAVLAEKAKVLKLQTELADMQRKLEGKSAHELGEGSEVDLFEQLRTAFEGDRIRRVSKGVNGADVIHEVVHNGKVCGKIIYDAKNRNAWQNEFASKLRADKLAEGADHAILSSNKFPRDRQQVHFQDGVIVANPARVVALVEILRSQVVRMHELRMSGEAREQKTAELYSFITSEHFKQLLETVEAQAGKMVELETKEQEAHRRIWDQRAKLIRSVQKARSDLSFEIDRIIGTAGNGPEDLPAD